MMRNNHNNSSCNYTEQIVSYLYDEFSGAEKDKFNEHLGNCNFCAVELKSFGFVRSSISEWRDEHFSNLETPIIHVPIEDREKSFSVVTKSNTFVSWIGGLSKIFSFNPVFAGLAILVVCVGAALFAFNFSGGTSEISANKINKNPNETLESALLEDSRKSREIKIADNNSKLSSSEPEVLSREIKSEKPVAPNKAVVRVSNNIPKHSAENPVDKVKESKDGIKKAQSVQIRQIPNLTNTEVEEDESIRLADLFDELDTK